LTVDAKQCTACQKVLPFECFTKAKTYRDGYRPKCRACVSAYNADYRAKNREKLAAQNAEYLARPDIKARKVAYDARRYEEQGEAIRARVAAYAAANPEKVRALNLKRSRANREKEIARWVEWNRRNPQKIRAAIKRWHAANPDAQRTYRAARRARIREAGGTYTKEDVRRLMRLQRGKCAACRTCLLRGYNVDHVVALKNGGSNGPENLQLLCFPCNMKKGTKDPIKFMQEKGFLL
jgi:5-methylcytosine-specific restriction endonuclease McrA